MQFIVKPLNCILSPVPFFPLLPLGLGSVSLPSCFPTSIVLYFQLTTTRRLVFDFSERLRKRKMKIGSRHNRKRARRRGRPRNRGHTSLNASPTPPSLISPLISDIVLSLCGFSLLPLVERPSTWSNRQLPWPGLRARETKAQQDARLRLQAESADRSYDKEMEAERLRMFGGVEGDDTALCAEMLDVVMTLFDGNIDYKDP